jgi:hypothetical protein
MLWSEASTMPMDDLERRQAYCRRCQSKTAHWRGRIGYGPFGRPSGLALFFALFEVLSPWHCSACGSVRWPWHWR